MQRRTRVSLKSKPTPQEVIEVRNMLPVLAQLIESQRITIGLGPVRDVKDWLNNYQAFEKSDIASIEAAAISVNGSEIQFDLGLDDYAS
jgi:hypothetical protein